MELCAENLPVNLQCPRCFEEEVAEEVEVASQSQHQRRYLKVVPQVPHWVIGFLQKNLLLVCMLIEAVQSNQILITWYVFSISGDWLYEEAKNKKTEKKGHNNLNRMHSSTKCKVKNLNNVKQEE